MAITRKIKASPFLFEVSYIRCRSLYYVRFIK